MKLSLEGLTERVLPSASAATPPPVADVTSPMVSAMDQLTHVVAIIQNDVSNVWKAIAQEAAYVHEQWDHFLGITPTAQQPGSGSGSGSGAMTTAHNAQTQQPQSATLQAGSGSGSGATTTVHENISKQRVMPLAGSGSGSGSLGSGIVNGQVYLDNDGDGFEDNGEYGFSGITVNLIDASTGQTLDTMITDDNGDYQFEEYIYQDKEVKIQVVIPNCDYATIYGAGSQIDANGYSPVFTMFKGANNAVNAPPAGISSTTVTTTQDNPPNGVVKDNVTLRDAIKTVINGLNEPVRFKDGVTGTISLQAALPILSKNIRITGPGDPSKITIQGNASATNPYGMFIINSGVNAEIDYVTIEGGYDSSQDSAGGILNYGILDLTNDTIQDNTESQGSGGGIKNATKAQLFLTNVLVQFNSAPNGGGIANFGSLSDSGASAEIIANNATSATGVGGGIYNNGGTVKLENGAQISGNTAPLNGGGIFNAGSDSKFTMDGGFISNNDATGGGGLYNDSGTVTLDSSLTVQKNQAKYGAGLYLKTASTTNLNTITIQNNVLVANGLGQGYYRQTSGATLNTTKLMMADTKFTGKSGAIPGGNSPAIGIYTNSGALTLTNIALPSDQRIANPGNTAISIPALVRSQAALLDIEGIERELAPAPGLHKRDAL